MKRFMVMLNDDYVKIAWASYTINAEPIWGYQAGSLWFAWYGWKRKLSPIGEMQSHCEMEFRPTETIANRNAYPTADWSFLARSEEM